MELRVVLAQIQTVWLALPHPVLLASQGSILVEVNALILVQLVYQTVRPAVVHSSVLPAAQDTM